MRITAVISLFIIGLLNSTTGQSNDLIDSLKIALQQPGLSDSMEGVYYHEIGSAYIYSNSDSFYHYSKQASISFNKAGHQNGLIAATLNIAHYMAGQNEVDSALFYLDVIKERIDTSDYHNLLNIYYNYGFLHHNTTLDYEQAVENYLVSLEYATLLQDSTRMGGIEYNIAEALSQSYMYASATEHYQSALHLANDTSLQALKSATLMGLGINFSDLAVYDSSIHYFLEAEAFIAKDIDIANSYMLNSGLATAYYQQEDYRQAYKYASKSKLDADMLNSPYELAQAACNLAAASIMTDRYVGANRNWNNFLSINDELDHAHLGEVCFQLMSEAYGKKKRFREAYEAQLQFIAIKDSVFNEENRKVLKDLEVKYQTEIKATEIEKQELRLRAQVSQRNSILRGSVLLALLALGVIWYLIQRSIKNRVIFQQENELKQQKIEKLEKEKKILGMNAMIEGQEAERTRIAKDLHDGLGGLLSTVKAHFSNIQSEIQKIEKINVYNRANELVDEACDEVRRISHNLMPGALRLEGLIAAVESLGEDMEAAHPFAVRVETDGMKTRMDESKEVFVFRIIQEALNNIIKHANAKEVLIQLSETTEEYHYIVEDDGDGFDPLLIQSGLGLKSIQSRVDFLKGALDVDTRKGVGTTLSWHIPK